MCGIYGYLGNPTRKTRRVLRLLGLYNQARGIDSSGMAIIQPADFQIYKAVGNSYRFFQNTPALKSVVNDEYLNIIGHTRNATTGKVNYKNAHPYNYGDIIYAHNGIITNHWKLEKELDQDYEVDSQVIGELIDTLGEKQTFEKKLQGWFAIPYASIAQPNTLNLIRHNAPLAVAIRPDRRGMYFTSDSQHLLKALRKTGEKAPVNTLAEDTKYQFRYMDGLTYTKTKYTIKTNTTYYYGYGYSGYSYNDYYTSKAWSEPKKYKDNWKKATNYDSRPWVYENGRWKRENIVQQCLLAD